MDHKKRAVKGRWRDQEGEREPKYDLRRVSTMALLEELMDRAEDAEI